MATEKAPISFVIKTEITSSYFDDVLRFVHRQYILPLKDRFVNVKLITLEEEHLLSFRSLGPGRTGYVDVEMRSGNPIQVKMFPSDMFPQAALDQLRADLFFGVQLFEELVRRTTLYFAWVEGEEVIPEKIQLKRRNIIYRLFSESMLFFFAIFIVASIFLFIFLGPIAPIVLVAFQFVLVLFSARIFMRTGEWRVTQKNPYVHLFQYHLPIEDLRGFQQKYDQDKLIKIKAEIYEKTLAVGKAIDCQTAGEVLSRYGFKCAPENMSTKVVNVYEIVKKAAEKFKLPVPSIAITNTILPNAAASGPSPSHGVVLITTGMLVQLEDEEILSVLGHEFGHLRGRDPLILFGLTAAEFLLRVYVFWPIFLSIGFPFFLVYLYLFLAFSVIFFIAKFFEARADLESAIKIGQPKVLASALRKIGFRRLQFERASAYRVQEWLGWDSHPPIYFRVARLEQLEDPQKIRHPLIQSIKDNIRGFLQALR